MSKKKTSASKRSVALLTTMSFAVLVSVLAASSMAATTYASLAVSSQFSPSTIGPGESGSMILTIANAGTAYARDVKLTIKSNSYVSFGQQKYDLQTVAPGASVQISVPVTVNSGTAQNAVSIFMSLDYAEGDTTGTKTIESSVSMSISRKLFVQIEDVKWSKDLIEPGNVIDATIHLKNVGIGSVKYVTVTMDDSDLPFVSAAGDNEIYVGTMPSDTTSTAAFSIIINKDAKTTAYRVPIVVKYYDESGVLYTDTKYIGLKISGLPDFVVAFESDSNMYAEGQGELTISIANRGTATASYLTLKFDHNGQESIYAEPSEYYVGNLDPDDFQTVKLGIDLSSMQPGKKTLNIIMEYKDPYNQAMSKTASVDFIVHEKLTSLQPTNIIIVAAIIVAIVLWKRKSIARIFGKKV